jgi:hypothetical protein
MPFQPVIPAFLRRLWPRAAAPVTVVLALLSACGLSSMEAAPFVSSAQAHTPSPVQSPAWPGVWSGQVARAEPVPVRFSPPSAEHCRRLPGLREVSWPGAPQQEALLGRRRIHGESEAGLESAAPATPAAAPAPGSTGGSRTVVNELKKSITDKFRGDGALDGKADSTATDGPRAAESAAAAFVMPPMPQPPRPQPERQRPAHEAVTAGMVDDNADFGEYRAYRERALRAGVNVRDRDVSERTLLEVTDARGRPVHDAEVAVQRAGQAQPVMWARTDTAGRVWLHPRVFLPAEAQQQQDARWGVAVRKGSAQAHAVWQRGQSQALQVRLADAPQPQGRARLDLVFLVDATGSMGDEIAKLKSSMRAMADQLSQLPGSPDVCYGLVTYRDRGDAYLTRSHDFTNDLPAFQAALGRVQAQGGGDTPEALNEALSETVHGLSWRQDAVRLVVLVADAPPHLDYCDGAFLPQQQQQAGAPCPQYDQDMQAALAKGIKLLAVGAGGLDPSGEFIFRQMAQYTAGRFVFLTYKNAAQPGSGPGGETVHDVTQYSVQTLDKLVVRLVGEELARLRTGAV